MIAFGAGTLPAMLSLSYLGTRWAPHNQTFAQLAGGIIVACGLWTAAAPIAALGGAQPHVHQHVH